MKLLCGLIFVVGAIAQYKATAECEVAISTTCKSDAICEQVNINYQQEMDTLFLDFTADTAKMDEINACVQQGISDGKIEATAQSLCIAQMIETKMSSDGCTCLEKQVDCARNNGCELIDDYSEICTAMFRCSADQCINGTGNMCPTGYPFPYHYGEYCCKNGFEKVNAPQGSGCDGSSISLSSVCCQDDAFVACPIHNCVNFEHNKQCGGPRDLTVKRISPECTGFTTKSVMDLCPELLFSTNDVECPGCGPACDIYELNSSIRQIATVSLVDLIMTISSAVALIFILFNGNNPGRMVCGFCVCTLALFIDCGLQAAEIGLALSSSGPATSSTLIEGSKCLTKQGAVNLENIKATYESIIWLGGFQLLLAASGGFFDLKGLKADITAGQVKIYMGIEILNVLVATIEYVRFVDGDLLPALEGIMNPISSESWCFYLEN